jgi:uncharacterized protein (TIGR03085 family)
VTAGRLGVARSERLLLCDLLEELGPLSPTLCLGWNTGDLAAHLFLRERRPVAALGIAVPPLTSFTRREMDSLKRSLGHEGLLERLRAGPPRPFLPVEEAFCAVEFFVHHEDVRRAGDAPPTPREDVELDEVLWRRLRRYARFLARRLHGAGLELVAPGFGALSARRGVPVATLSGGPQELTLFLFGRGSVAAVELDGRDDVRRAVEGAVF